VLLDQYPPIKINRKSGDESFEIDGQTLPFNLLEFWQWSSSDLVGNALRGVLAEYIVASALGCDAGTRTEWDAHDLVTKDGIKVEVKSAAYGALEFASKQARSSLIVDLTPRQELVCI
jgi:hypothetical protein